MTDSPVFLLVDNGSLQPAATLRLRHLADALSRRTGRTVEPVSLLHSSAIPASELEGRPAEILEPTLRRRFAEGRRDFVIVPLFFGRSAALTDYIPERVRALSATLSGLSVRVAPPLVDVTDPVDPRLTSILRDLVHQTISARRLECPWVILVDHGSPQPAVGAVRDRVACDLAAALAGIAARVDAASMERREGAAYDFNEPLLAQALRRCDGPGVVAPLFFSPGRHAGPDGDISQICREAEADHPGLKVHLAPLVGEHPGLVEILADRLHTAAS